jgi:hypothetical protein
MDNEPGGIFKGRVSGVIKRELQPIETTLKGGVRERSNSG